MEAEPESEPRTEPGAIGRSIAKRWCLAGGEQFGPPGGDPDVYPPPLESCKEISVDLWEPRVLGVVSATILEVDAYYETREVLLVQDDAGDHTHELAHHYADESGEAGVYTRIYESVELRDVYGGPSPEWIATTLTTGGDSFEADRCYAHESTSRELVICTVASSELRCAQVTISAHERIEPRAPDQLYDCEDHPPADDASHRGYALNARVERGAVVFSPADTPVLDGLREGPFRQEPPYEGRVSMDTLFEEQEAEAD